MSIESPWRDRFPGIAGGWARLDGPSGTQLVDTGLEAITTFLRDGSFANDGGAFPASKACDEVLIKGRASVATLLGAQPDEISFHVSSTAHMYGLTRALGAQWQAGDEIVCSELEHDCNVAPWIDAARDAGASVHTARVNPVTCRLDLDHLDEVLTERTRWLAITAASNATGSAPDLAAIIAMAHDRGVKVLVDAVAYAPHRKIDVGDLGCDALITSPYKWFAPHSGVLWLSPEVQTDLPRYQIRASHHSGPSVMEYGSTPFEIVVAVGAAADFLVETGMDTIRAHEESLLSILLPGLLSIPGVRVHGEPEVGPERVPTLGFTVKGWNPDEVCAAMAEDKIAGWSGDFYAIDLAHALDVGDTGGWVRLGINLYNSEDDVQRALSSIARIADSRSGSSKN